MIIVHLIYDTCSLLACSLTCYSWYLVSVPHLHHTLVTRSNQWSYRPKYAWTRSLRNANKLGLHPLVKKFQVLRADIGDGLSSRQFNHCSLRQFSALANVQELEIGDLDIPSFLPRIRRYFRNFFLTVRSLGLIAPKGSHRQIIFFIGQFEYLEDLTLLDGTLDCWVSEPTDDPTLIPPFTPPLRGQLVMMRFRRAGFSKDMVDLLGGIRFRYVDLFDADGMQLLLSACTKTLETLRLYPTDPCGK